MSYISKAEFAPADGIEELSFNEIEAVAGGPGPLVAGVAGGVGGAGVALFVELTDDKPGVNGGNIVIGAAAGAGAALTGLLGVGAGVAGTVGFGAFGITARRINSEIASRPDSEIR